MDKLDITHKYKYKYKHTQIQIQIQTHTNTNAREKTTKDSFHAIEDWQTNLVGNIKPKELQELLSIIQLSIVIAIFIGEINEYLAKVLLMVINAILQAFIGPKRIRTFVTMMVMMII